MKCFKFPKQPQNFEHPSVSVDAFDALTTSSNIRFQTIENDLMYYLNTKTKAEINV